MSKSVLPDEAQDNDFSTFRQEDLTLTHLQDNVKTRQLLLAVVEKQHLSLRSHIEDQLATLRTCIEAALTPSNTPELGTAADSSAIHSGCQQASDIVMPLPEVPKEREVPSWANLESIDALEFEENSPKHPDSKGVSSEPSWVSSLAMSDIRKRTRQHILRFSGKEGLRKLVESTTFDVIIGVVITLNAISMVVYYEWLGYKASLQLGIRTDDSQWKGTQTWFLYMEHGFAILFGLEFVLRLYALKLQFFLSVANIFDALLVVSSLIELYVLGPMGASMGANLLVLRLVRLLRFVRVLRVVRVMRMFMSLRILVRTITASLSSLVWSMLLLFSIICVSGLFMCSLLSDYVIDDSQPDDIRKWVYEYYGSSTRATYTMFEATLSGCWPNYSRRLIEEVSAWYVMFFIVYIAGVVFAVTRIISALFLRETLANADLEQDDGARSSMVRQSETFVKLNELFEEADQHGNGLMDRKDFQAVLNNSETLKCFEALDLQACECTDLLNLIDDAEGKVSPSDFLDNLLRLKLSARSSDVIAIMRAVERLAKQVDSIQQRLNIPIVPRSFARRFMSRGPQEVAKPHIHAMADRETMLASVLATG